MKRVTYGGGSFLTGDRIADAVLDYAAQIARAESADHLVVPAVGIDGRPIEVDIVVGPASQLLAQREEVDTAELLDDSFVQDLDRRGRMANGGRADQIDPRGHAEPR